MATSRAGTVEEYLGELPEDRRAVISHVRDVIRSHLPQGYEEAMRWGMISYEIPLSRYPSTYNGQPLSFAAIAAQKGHYSVYLNCAYGDEEQTSWLAGEFERAGKRMDMGKSCLRFRKLDDLSLDAIGELVRRNPPERYIEKYEASRR